MKLITVIFLLLSISFLLDCKKAACQIIDIDYSHVTYRVYDKKTSEYVDKPSTQGTSPELLKNGFFDIVSDGSIQASAHCSN